MLFYYCTKPERLSQIREYGVPSKVRVWTRLEAALAQCLDILLVIDPSKLEDPVEVDSVPSVEVDRIPASAFINLEPFLEVKPVLAAGGVVLRKHPGGKPDVLMIYRNKVWDLPKGKQEKGETAEETAMREVREEVGIRAVRLIKQLGTTVHGYERKGEYHVKTTYWYQMATPEKQFKPQAEENIEKAGWVPWDKSLEVVGYPTLKTLLEEAQVY